MEQFALVDLADLAPPAAEPANKVVLFSQAPSAIKARTLAERCAVVEADVQATQSCSDVAGSLCTAVIQEEQSGGDPRRLREESNLWRLMAMMAQDAEQGPMRCPAEIIPANLPASRRWSVTHNAAVQQFVQENGTHRKLVAVLRWLEETYEKPKVFSPENIRDTPAAEEFCLDTVLKCIRGGDISSAVQLAELMKMSHVVAMLKGAVLSKGREPWSNRTMSVPLFSEYDQSPATRSYNDHRVPLLSKLYGTCDKGGSSEQRIAVLDRALCGALSGHRAALTAGFGTDDWRTKLWCIIRCDLVLSLSLSVVHYTGTKGLSAEYSKAMEDAVTNVEDRVIAFLTSLIVSKHGSFLPPCEDLQVRCLLVFLNSSPGSVHRTLMDLAERCFVLGKQQNRQKQAYVRQHDVRVAAHLVLWFSKCFEKRLLPFDIQESPYAVKAVILVCRAAVGSIVALDLFAPLLVQIHDPGRRAGAITKVLKKIRSEGLGRDVDPVDVETEEGKVFAAIRMAESMRHGAASVVIDTVLELLGQPDSDPDEFEDPLCFGAETSEPVFQQQRTSTFEEADVIRQDMLTSHPKAESVMWQCMGKDRALFPCVITNAVNTAVELWGERSHNAIKDVVTVLRRRVLPELQSEPRLWEGVPSVPKDQVMESFNGWNAFVQLHVAAAEHCEVLRRVESVLSHSALTSSASNKVYNDEYKHRQRAEEQLRSTLEFKGVLPNTAVVDAVGTYASILAASFVVIPFTDAVAPMRELLAAIRKLNDFLGDGDGESEQKLLEEGMKEDAAQALEAIAAAHREYYRCRGREMCRRATEGQVAIVKAA